MSFPLSRSLATSARKLPLFIYPDWSVITHDLVYSQYLPIEYDLTKTGDDIPRPLNAFMLFRAEFVRRKHVPGSIEQNHNNLSKIIGERPISSLYFCDTRGTYRATYSALVPVTS